MQIKQADTREQVVDNKKTYRKSVGYVMEVAQEFLPVPGDFYEGIPVPQIRANKTSYRLYKTVGCWYRRRTELTELSGTGTGSIQN